MIGRDVRDRYKATIGIECHVQLKTRTKLFAAIDNDAREAPPNTLVSHICFGLPGALPVLNAEAVRIAARAAFVLNSRPAKFSKFDRKHYFYPDLPKGYQISQYDEPIITGGFINVPVVEKSETRMLRVGVTRAHLEEDAGKSMHPSGADYSLVDLNRAGTPLLEIVSKPDMHSPNEARSYAKELYLLMRYADVSDCDLYQGHMRFDVNVSVSKEAKRLGIRTETKNINSFRNVERAVEYEINRQIARLERGLVVTQETRGWDEAKQKTVSQRSKEEAQDYRYMPDPDIPPIELDDAYIANVEKDLPMLPPDYRKKFAELAIDKSVIEDIIAYPEITYIVDAVLSRSTAEAARRAAFWLMAFKEDEAASINRQKHIDPDELIKLSELISGNKLSSSAAKEVFDELRQYGGKVEQIADSKNLLQVTDESALTAIVVQVMENNPKAVEDIRLGQARAIGFLIGQVMQASGGKASPQLVTQIIRRTLDKQGK